jgi:hypothetical protein
MSSNIKPIEQIIVFAGFLALCVLALLNAQERLFVDSGYYFFHVVNSEWFHIEHNRLILGLSQIALLISVKLGVNMKGLIQVYSLSHIVFFFMIYLLAKFRYQDESAGISLLLIQTLGITQGFFVPMFELYYAAGLLVLFNAILRTEELSVIERSTAIFLTIFIASAHFMAVAVFLVVVTFRFIEKPKVNLSVHIGSIICITAVLLFKKYNISPYEQGKIDWFLNGLNNFKITTNYLTDLVVFFTKNYKDYLVLSLLTLIILVSKRRWVKTFIFLSASTLLTIIVTISDPWFESTRYQEQVYFPLMVLVAFVAAQIISEKRQHRLIRNPLILCVAAILSYRVFNIHAQAATFNERLTEMKEQIGKTQEITGTKFIVADSSLQYDANWSYPIETLILSSDQNEKTVTMCTETDYYFDHNAEDLSGEKFLFRRWELLNLEKLNKQYFQLDSSDYQHLAF